jgi:hypothetical protein
MKHESTGRRKIFCFGLCALVYALCLSAEAQQPKKVPQVGILMPVSSTVAAPNIEASAKVCGSAGM